MTPRFPILVLSLLLASSAAAQLPRNEISLAGGWTDFARFGGAYVGGASYTRYWNPMLATQIGTFRTVQRGSRLTDVHLTAEVHGFRDRRFSPWGALGVTRMVFDDAEREETKNALIGGAGVDVNLSRRFAIGAQVHYSRFVMNENDREEANVHPITMTIAARWRY